MPPTTEEFRTELRNQIQRARRQGRPHAEINAGELHRVLGGYPPKRGEPAAAMPSCCNAMREEFEKGNAEIVFEPEMGQGASLTIRYRFPERKTD